MQTIVIYPGRFQPFHYGHLAVYTSLVNQFGKENVFIATSDSQAEITSPFSFEEKKAMITSISGGLVDEDYVVQTKSPYRAVEITENFDPNSTILIYALSEKDKDRFSFQKEDGTLSYFQPVSNNMKPLKQHAYIMVVPVVEFEVAGIKMSSASELRSKYATAHNAERDLILSDLYGKMASTLRPVFDKKIKLSEVVSEMISTVRGTRMASNAKTLAILENVLRKEKAVMEESNPIEPEGGLGTWNEEMLRKNAIEMLKELAVDIASGNYGGAYYKMYQHASTKAKFKALADLDGAIGMEDEV